MTVLSSKLNDYTKLLLVLILLIIFNSGRLYSQIAHPNRMEVSAEGLENPSLIYFSLGSEYNDLDIDYVGGDYWSNPAKFPSSLFKPLKGSIKDVYKSRAGWFISYEPYPFVEGVDEFTYNMVLKGGIDKNFTASVEFKNISRKPYLLENDSAFSDGAILPNEIVASFPENQRTAYTFTFFDPEPEYTNFADYLASPNSASISLEQDGDYFEIVSLGSPVLKDSSSVGLNGVTTNYSIQYKHGVDPPDFELISDNFWTVDLVLNDKVHGSEIFKLDLTLSDVYEPPQPQKFLIPQIDDDDKSFKGKEVTIAERNLSDTESDAPCIKIEFKVRSEGQDSIVDGNKTFKFKYNIIFNQSGINSFLDEDNETVLLNMYDTLSVPPESDFVPYSPERVYLYTSSYDFDELSSTPNPDSDLNIIELSRGNYPVLDNDQPILLKSSESYGLVISFADDYFTFDDQPVTFQFTAEDGDASDLLFDLKVNIENDFSDPIKLMPVPQINESGFRLLGSPSSDLEYFVTFQEHHPDNEDLKILNIDSIDADRHPHAHQQIDYNNSTGGFEQGAGIFYDLKGQYKDLFEVDNRGVLSFKEMPNYEVDQTVFLLELGVHDSPDDLVLGVADTTTSDPNIQLNFTITDGPDMPILKHSQVQFSSFTKENDPLDLYSFFDGIVNDFLEVSDEDGIDGIFWGSSGYSQNGGGVEIDRSNNTFIYTPPTKFFGTDNLRIFYYDTKDVSVLGEDNVKQYVDFEIVVTNKNDDPVIGFILSPGKPSSFFKGGIPLYVEDYQDADGVLSLNFNENEPISLKLPFNDLLDRQDIVSVNQEGNLDRFTVSEPYQDATYDNLEDGEYLWFVDLNWTAADLPDYESIEGVDKSYSLLLTAVDEVNDFSSFPINITINDVPEPPYFKISPSSGSISQIGSTFLVPEEFTGSILELTPADSEGVENVQEWNWEINDDSLSKNTSRFFRLEYDGELTETYATSSTSAPKIRLSFNPDLRPSYEDFLDDEDILK